MSEIKSINPATGGLRKEFEEMSLEDARRILADVDFAWKDWRQTSYSERAELMKKVAKDLIDYSHARKY